MIYYKSLDLLLLEDYLIKMNGLNFIKNIKVLVLFVQNV
jgi:hypothetical protein